MARIYKYHKAFSKPSVAERLIGAASYLSMGIIGMIWLIITYMQKSMPTNFVKYHIFQSLFIAVLTYALSLVSGIIINLARIVPIVGDLIMLALGFLSLPILYGYSIINVAMLVILLYLSISTLLGKYAYIPWVSDNIRKML